MSAEAWGPLCAACGDLPVVGGGWLCESCEEKTDDERELAAKTRKPWPGEAGPAAEALRRAMCEEARGRQASAQDFRRHMAQAAVDETWREIAETEREEMR